MSGNQALWLKAGGLVEENLVTPIMPIVVLSNMKHPAVGETFLNKYKTIYYYWLAWENSVVLVVFPVHMSPICMSNGKQHPVIICQEYGFTCYVMQV